MNIHRDIPVSNCWKTINSLANSCRAYNGAITPTRVIISILQMRTILYQFWVSLSVFGTFIFYNTSIFIWVIFIFNL